MKTIVYSCDLCNKPFDPRDRYDPDNTKISGLCLISPGSTCNTWQRIIRDNNETMDICTSCSLLIIRLINMKPMYPFTINMNLGVEPKNGTIDENEIRKVLRLDLSYNPSKIIIYGKE